MAQAQTVAGRCNTGMLCARSLMLALQADAEAHGATVALNSAVVWADVTGAAAELWSSGVRMGQLLGISRGALALPSRCDHVWEDAFEAACMPGVRR